MESPLLNLGKLKPKTKKHKNLETTLTTLASSAPYLGTLYPWKVILPLRD